MDKRFRTELVIACEKVLSIAVPCTAVCFCVWIIMNHAAEFAGRTSIIKVEAALTIGLGIATSGAGIGYGLYQKKLRKQADKAHELQVQQLQSLIAGAIQSKGKGAGK